MNPAAPVTRHFMRLLLETRAKNAGPGMDTDETPINADQGNREWVSGRKDPHSFSFCLDPRLSVFHPCPSVAVILLFSGPPARGPHGPASHSTPGVPAPPRAASRCTPTAAA